MNSFNQYYEILGLSLNASQEEVKQAYRLLVKQWHPDLFTNNLQKQKEAEEKFKQISLAYEALKDFQPESSSFAVSSEIATKHSQPESFYQHKRKQ